MSNIKYINKVVQYPTGHREERLSNQSKPKIEIIDKETALVLETGELIRRKQPKTKYDCILTVQTQLIRSREKIFNNAGVHIPNVWEVVLSFEDSIKDIKVAEEKNRLFLKKMRRKYSGIKYGVWRELQMPRKVWHFHYIFWHDTEKINFTGTEIKKIWGNGKASAKQINTEEDFINFLFYLTNYTYSFNGKNKKKINSLKYIDANVKLFSCSRGLEKPTIIYTDKRNTDEMPMLSSNRKQMFNNEMVPTCVFYGPKKEENK